MKFYALRIRALVTTLILLELLLLIPARLSAETLRVPEEFPTISAAMNAASPGDEVLVGPGEYNENVLMSPGVSLVGAGPDNTLVDGGLKPAIVCAEDCSVGQLRLISGSTVATLYSRDVSVTLWSNEISGGGYGILCTGGTIVAVGNELHDNYASGIKVDGCDAQIDQNLAYFNDLDGILSFQSTIEVTGNFCFGNVHAGINCRDGTVAYIEGNIAQSNHHTGIFFIRSTGSVLGNDSSRNAQMGLRAVDSTDVTFSFNSVTENFDHGVQFMNSSGQVLGCTIQCNRLAGIHLAEGSDVTISGNVLERNFEGGVLVEEGSNAALTNNYYHKNYTNGISVLSSATAQIVNETSLEDRFNALHCEQANHVTVRRCMFLRSHLLGIGAIDADVEMSNSVVAGPFYNGIFSDGSSLNISNNAFFSIPLTCILCQDFGPHIIVNNIFANAQHAVWAAVQLLPVGLEIAYDDAWAMEAPPYVYDDGSVAFMPSPGTGLISADPLFADPQNYNFHLQAGSPCIDAGLPESSMNDRDGSINDMGAYGGPYAGFIGAAPLIRPHYWSSEPRPFTCTIPYGFSIHAPLLSVEASLLPLGKYEVVAGAIDPNTPS
ncbi:MAG TPA: right-handed parallel beta-helix repeat-containing protein [bacterium]|nr:right-handed parallel beta-helix repeat-containing protein [bacterium]